MILSNKLYTVQKHLTLDGHVYSPALLLISPTVWAKVSEADRKAFQEAARLALAANRKRVNEDEAKGIAIIRNAGVSVVEKVDLTRFQTAVAPAYAVYAKEFGADRIKKIQDVK